MRGGIKVLSTCVTAVAVGVLLSSILGCIGGNKNAGSVEEKQNSAADVVYTNGKIYTVDRAHPFVDAVAVKDGRFLAVGSGSDIQGLVGERTRVVDLGGAFAVPGFIDGHIHPAQPYLHEEGGALLFPESLNKQQIAEAVAAYLRNNPNAPYHKGS